MTRLFDAKPFIIAEVGSSWRDLSDCMASISAAKAVGADAVKFQAFSNDALYGPNLGGYRRLTPEERQSRREWCEREGRIDTLDPDFAWFKKADGPQQPRDKHPYELDLSWLPKLAEKAKAVGIELMCTAFSPELVAAVDPFVSVHKVASSDLSWPQLLEAVAKTGKPVLLSTGASGQGDINDALRALGRAATGTVLMYCVSAYPARMTDLRVMELLRQPFGFSDHSTDIIGHPVEAARRGAVAIEKHFTAFPELASPDRPHSLTTDEFKIMVDAIRGVRQPVIGPTPEERPMMLRHNRRLIATRDVSPGEPLRYGQNYGAYRSLEDDTRGFSPFAWGHIEGKTAAVTIGRGKPIGPGDFK